MFSKRRVLIGSPIAFIAIVAIAWYIIVGAASPNAEPITPATAEQKQEFLSLIQKYDRTFFEGWVTGDLSQFPTVFYNDPRYPPDSIHQDWVDAHRADIDVILAKDPSGPVGSSTGELASEMADVISRRGSDAAWNAAQTKARAEGRNPTLKDMPNGQPPVMTPQESDFVQNTFYITDAEIQGGVHAKVSYVIGDPDSPLFFNLELTKVNDQWYISKYWTTGNL